MRRRRSGPRRLLGLGRLLRALRSGALRLFPGRQHRPERLGGASARQLRFQRGDLAALRTQRLQLRRALGALHRQLAHLGELVVALLRQQQLAPPLGRVLRSCARHGRCLLQRLGGGVAEPLLLGGHLPSALLVGPHLAGQLLPQVVAVFLQMEQPLQHRPAIRPLQREKFGEFALG